MHTATKPSTPDPNEFAAALAEIGASMAIANKFFGTPPSLLSIAAVVNVFLNKIAPEPMAFSMTRHARIYTQLALLGREITDADCDYLEEYSVRPASLFKEFIGLATKGFALYSHASLGFNLVTQGVWGALKGAGLMTATYFAPSIATTLAEQFMKTLSPEYQFLKPWLAALARLPAQFIPRVSVDEAGELQIQWPEFTEKALPTACGLAYKAETEDGISLTFTDPTTGETKTLDIHAISETEVHLTSPHDDRVLREACAARLEESGLTVTSASLFPDVPTAPPTEDAAASLDLAPSAAPTILDRLASALFATAPMATTPPARTPPTDLFKIDTKDRTHAMYYIRRAYVANHPGDCVAHSILKIFLPDSTYQELKEAYLTSTGQASSSLIPEIKHPLASLFPAVERRLLSLMDYLLRNHYQSDIHFTHPLLETLFNHLDRKNPIALTLKDGTIISGDSPAIVSKRLFEYVIKQFVLVHRGTFKNLHQDTLTLPPGIYQLILYDPLIPEGHSWAISISTSRTLVFEPSTSMTTSLEAHLKSAYFKYFLEQTGMTENNLQVLISSANPKLQPSIKFLKSIPVWEWEGGHSLVHLIRSLALLASDKNTKHFKIAFTACFYRKYFQGSLEIFNYFHEKYPEIINLHLKNTYGMLLVTYLVTRHAATPLPELQFRAVFMSLLNNTRACNLPIDVKEENGITLMTLAAQHNLVHFATLLMENGFAMHNAVIIDGSPILDPVYTAVDMNKQQILIFFCQAGIDWQQYSGAMHNPLTLAIYKKNIPAIELLIATPGAPIKDKAIRAQIRALGVKIPKAVTATTTPFASTPPKTQGAEKEALAEL